MNPFEYDQSFIGQVNWNPNPTPPPPPRYLDMLK